MANTPRTSGVFSLGALGGDVAASGDPHWSNVTLLLDGTSATADAANQSTVSTYGTVNANQGSAGAKWANTYYIGLPNSGHVNVTLPTGKGLGRSGTPFTVEGWVRFDALGDDGIFQLLSNPLSSSYQLPGDSLGLMVTSSNWKVYKAAGSANSGLGSVSTGTYYHVALTSDGTTLRWYVDGNQIEDYPVASATGIPAGGFPYLAIGGYFSLGYPMDGRIQDFRVTDGVARYTGSGTQTIPSGPLPQGAAVAASTRPTRRWGGMTGRSLVATTTGAAPLWTPDDVTNTAEPAIWLDASTGLTTNKGSLSTTVTLGAGAWSSSGTQNGLTTAINSAAGTVVPISFTGTTVASVAMLYRWDSAGASRTYATTFSGSTAADYVFHGGYGSAVLHTYGVADSHNWDHVREDGAEYATTHNTAAAWSTRTTDWMLHVFVLDGTRTATINRWGFERTNTNRQFTGEIAEVMAFPGKLSQSECEQVEGYLAHKWGLASLLPSAHSYKSAAPTSGTGPSSTNVPTTGVLSLPELLQARYGVASAASIDVLVVGGGSGRTLLLSSQHYSSGGNGGSIVRRTGFQATPGTAYTISVGAGAASIDGSSTATESVGSDGGSTSFGSLTAAGGVAQQSNHDAHSYTNKTSADIDGTVTNYSASAGSGAYAAASGAGAGGSATTNVGGAAYSYAVNGTTVNANISSGANWNTSATQASSVSGGVPYGRGGEGGYNVSSPGGDGVVYVAYPTGTVSSYTWSGAAGDINEDTSTVSGYTILRFTGNGNWTPS